MFFRLETNCLSIDFQVKDGKLILWYKLSEFIIAIYSDYKRKNDLFFFFYLYGLSAVRNLLLNNIHVGFSQIVPKWTLIRGFWNSKTCR